MKYPHDTAKTVGVLVPLAGLRSKQSVGTGEFADLRLLGDWCRQSGIGLIQLLPVNDTGGESSPYSALSANALHPIYVRLSDLPEFQALPDNLRNDLAARIADQRTRFEAVARFDYDAVLRFKMGLLREIFDAADREEINAAITTFLRKNNWVKTYAVYRALKRKHGESAWSDWPEYNDVDAATVNRLWKAAALAEDSRFFAWVQVRLADQFAAAAADLDSRGIALKGDIPILMNEDSVDAWYDRDIFRPELRAGAPPDMFSGLGQNWGFPIYNWENLADRDYDWWRERLKNAARYYHAYRIDHVLGFFRIWAVPSGNYTGIPGFFWPQHGISRDELYEAGFDDGRITWLQHPHIRGEEIRERFGTDIGTDTTNRSTKETVLASIFQRLGDEDLYLFADAVSGEQTLADLDLSAWDNEDELRAWLLEQFRDRALVPLPDGTYAPTWTFRECTRYHGISQPEKERFEELVAIAAAKSNELWADHGRHILSVMKESTEMLPCAEDLGVVPEAVPRVLTGLEILGLKIPRWTYYWDRPEQPIVPFHEYPELSVCAPSVHDTTTMRGWWETESGREELWEMIGVDGPCPDRFDPATARIVYRSIVNCPSRIVVFAMQDLLALSPETIHDNPENERVNVPGTYNAFNWTWRMPLSLEDLMQNPTLNAEVSALTAIRRTR